MDGERENMNEVIKEKPVNDKMTNDKKKWKNMEQDNEDDNDGNGIQYTTS